MADANTPIQSKFVQYNGQKYPLIDDTAIEGGYRSYPDYTDLPLSTDTDGGEKVLKDGMIAFLQDATTSNPVPGAAYYQYNGTTWEVWGIAASAQNLFETVSGNTGSVTATGTDDTLSIVGDGTLVEVDVAGAGTTTATITVNGSASTTAVNNAAGTAVLFSDGVAGDETAGHIVGPDPIENQDMATKGYVDGNFFGSASGSDEGIGFDASIAIGHLRVEGYETSGPNKTYVVTNDGLNGDSIGVYVKASEDGTAETLAAYDTDGQLTVAIAPVDGTDLTNKTYVDAQVLAGGSKSFIAEDNNQVDLTPSNTSLTLDTAVSTSAPATAGEAIATSAAGNTITTTIHAKPGGGASASDMLVQYDENGEILQSIAPSTGDALTNKTYVDERISVALASLDLKEPVVCVTTSDIGTFVAGGGAGGIGDTLTAVDLSIVADFDNTAIPLVAGMRVLVNSQTDKTQCGLFEVTTVAAGANSVLTRSTDFDGDVNTPFDASTGAMVANQSGDSAPSAFILFPQTGLNSGDVTFGTSELVFTPTTDPTAITYAAGDGLEQSGTTTITIVRQVPAAGTNGANLRMPVYGLDTGGEWEDGFTEAPVAGTDAQVLQANLGSETGLDRMKWDYLYQTSIATPIDATLAYNKFATFQWTDGTNPIFKEESETIDGTTTYMIPLGATLDKAVAAVNIGKHVRQGAALVSLDPYADLTATSGIFGSSTNLFPSPPAKTNLVNAGGTEYTQDSTAPYGKTVAGAEQIYASFDDGTSLLPTDPGPASSQMSVAWAPFIYVGNGAAPTGAGADQGFQDESTVGGGESFKDIDTPSQQRLVSSTNQVINLGTEVMAAGNHMFIAVPVGFNVEAHQFVDRRSGFRGGFQKINGTGSVGGAAAVTFGDDYYTYAATAATADYDIWMSDNTGLGASDIALDLQFNWL